MLVSAGNCHLLGATSSSLPPPFHSTHIHSLSFYHSALPLFHSLFLSPLPFPLSPPLSISPSLTVCDPRAPTLFCTPGDSRKAPLRAESFFESTSPSKARPVLEFSYLRASSSSAPLETLLSPSLSLRLPPSTRPYPALRAAALVATAARKIVRGRRGWPPPVTFVRSRAADRLVSSSPRR